MRLFSKYSAGWGAISRSTSKAKRLCRPPACALRVCSWKACAYSTNPGAMSARQRKRMSSSTPDMSPGPFTAAVVTVSDACSRAERDDLSGPAVAEALGKSGFQVVAPQGGPGEKILNPNTLFKINENYLVIVTTGGSGIMPPDVKHYARCG